MSQQPETLILRDDGTFPNSSLPVLVYRRPLSSQPDNNLAAKFEALFLKHHWTGAWRNGLFTVHHYHSTAHEVLGIYSGDVTAQLGGPEGPKLTVHAGDVVVLPAGVAHKNVAQSRDFRCVGAYPRGTANDMQYGTPEERPAADRRIAAVPLPQADPIFGPGGPLRGLWSSSEVSAP